MLTAAFVAVHRRSCGKRARHRKLPRRISGLTLPLVIGLAAAIAAGMLVALLHAWLAVTLRIDQIISGTIINIGAAGFTGYMYSFDRVASLVGAGSFSKLVVPLRSREVRSSAGC